MIVARYNLYLFGSLNDNTLEHKIADLDEYLSLFVIEENPPVDILLDLTYSILTSFLSNLCSLSSTNCWYSILDSFWEVCCSTNIPHKYLLLSTTYSKVLFNIFYITTHIHGNFIWSMGLVRWLPSKGKAIQ